MENEMIEKFNDLIKESVEHINKIIIDINFILAVQILVLILFMVFVLLVV